MMRNTALLAAGLIFGLALSAQAQFSFGIGAGGGGGGFYFGSGGGYYGPGHYGPYYGRRGYYPGYGRSGFGVRVGSLGYYEDDYYDGYGYGYSAPAYRYYYTRPQATYILPTNRVQTAQADELPSNRVPSQVSLGEGDVLIKSPADAPAAVGYGINGQWVYTMKPGEKQKLEAGRNWSIEFDRGIDGAAPAHYSLSPGTYQFAYSADNGWELLRQRDEPAGTDEVPLPPEAPPVEGPASEFDSE